MILTPAGYEHARTRLLEARARQAQRKERLTSDGHTPEELELLLGPVECFLAEQEEELQGWERLNA